MNQITLRCPICNSSKSQESKNKSLAFCKKCQSTYLYQPLDAWDSEVDEENDSDAYIPSKNGSDEDDDMSEAPSLKRNSGAAFKKKKAKTKQEEERASEPRRMFATFTRINRYDDLDDQELEREPTPHYEVEPPALSTRGSPTPFLDDQVTSPADPIVTTPVDQLMGEAPLDSPEQPILKSPPLSSTSVRLPSSTLFKNRSSIFSGKTANYFDFSSDEEDSIFSQHQLNKKPVVNNVKPEIYRKMFSSNDDKPAPKRHQSLSSFSRAIGNLFDSSDEEDIVASKRSFIKKEPIIKQEPMDYSPEIKSSSIFSRTSKLFDFSDDDDDDDMATVRKKPVFINPLELSDSEDEAPIKKLKSKQKTKSTDLPAIFSDVYLPKPKAKLPKQDPSEFSDIEEMPMEDYRNIDNYGRTIDIDRRKGNHITITKQKRLLYESESDSDTDQQKLGIYQSRSVYRPISDKTKHPTEQQISLSKLLQEKKRRPLHRFNPFILFNTKTRRKLAQENPTLTVHELSHLVAQAWRGLDSESKAKIEEEANQMKQLFIQSGGNGVIRPKRPPNNGFILFSNENMTQLRRENPHLTTVNAASKLLADKWRALDEKTRDRYKDRALKMKKRWIVEKPEDHARYISLLKRPEKSLFQSIHN